MYFTPDGKSAIVVAEARHRLDFRDPHTMAMQYAIEVPQCGGINHADFSIDGRYALFTCEFDGSLAKIDLVNRKVLGYLKLSMPSTRFREGVDPTSIVRVGNCMIDSLVAHRETARSGGALARFDVAPRGFALATLHRPSNVDDPERLVRLVRALSSIGTRLPIVFPVHPRTRTRLEAAAVSVKSSLSPRVLLSEPLGYLDFLQLEDAAAVVITDSGGVQEETTALGVPCLTVRDNTERPITITRGSNKLVGSNPDVLPAEVDAVLSGQARRGSVPELWDGQAGARAAKAILSFLS